MLTYALTKTGGVSLYEQLYRRVKDDILTGRLATCLLYTSDAADDVITV